jgi:hypothetical protein
MDFAFITKPNLVLNDPKKEYSTGVFIAQSTGGLLLGTGLGLMGAVIGLGFVSCSSSDLNCGLMEVILGASIGSSIGTSTGIWAIGKYAGVDGSFLLTLLAAGIGTGIGFAFSEALNGADEEFLILVVPTLTAMPAYYLSNKYMRTKVTLGRNLNPDLKALFFQAKLELILAKW